MKIEEMADVFLNSANLVPHAILILAPPSSYALNLKALIKVSKISWTSQLLYEILRSSLERKFDKTNFISPKKLPIFVNVRKQQVKICFIRYILQGENKSDQGQV